jgi:hypothetical protein
MQRLSAAVILSCIALACGGAAPTAPSRGAVVTLRVVDETFRVHLLDERQIEVAHHAANGGPARIPTAALSPGPATMLGGVGSWRTSNSPS